jgi:hypothetical protein
LAAFCLTVLAVGCETSSHKSVRTYEYSDEPPPEQQSQADEFESEYEMQSEGEMVSPGQMVGE